MTAEAPPTVAMPSNIRNIALPSWGQIALVLSLWAMMRGLNLLAKANPELRPYTSVITWIYVAFCIYTWVAPGVLRAYLKRRRVI